ncbi:apoptosis facilitator Bcl-2-like protein 14 isoform X2 [Sinocyclocheilus grahami]|uniref:Apoptosis facilitator Bcl-2-like protein 14 n=1 Tax=Sinocyclocheilus grahami TaxID=75366 RepID=A0A672LG44_SINGR|nr:PREDICTED: apoptosis facilitator Bcl-2-like protein 14 isoform X2 [Sinocyclocheilus grahami]
MMDGDSLLTTCSDEYRLLETYCQKRRKPSARACDEKFGGVAEKLAQIAYNRLLFDEGLEPDSPVAKEANSDVIVRLVDLLKTSGDELNETIQSSQELSGYLQQTFSYDLFKKLTKAFITSSVPEFLQSRKKREQIALAFEVTSRLKALDLHPMNRVMGYGAQYLQENYAPWIKQHGGWEKAFDDDDDEEVL